jgi:tetratricopeptide (TPR) repeat protein
LDFFVSYTQADRQRADWIARVLEEFGYTAFVQDRDILPGSNFVLEMDRATIEADRVIAVLSPDYLAARYPQAEWSAALANGKLLPVRVRECELKGLLGAVAYIDLVGLEEPAAKKALVSGVQRPSDRPVKAARVPGSLPKFWNVPHLRNPNFTGREQLLQELRTALTSGRAAAIVPIAGLGGVGKTQLAVEYAYLHTDDYEIVWWVRAEAPSTLIGDYARLAAQLGLPEKDLADQQGVAAAVRSWLGHRRGWLLILDNAQNAADCREHLPMGGTGHVLITSRDPNWGSVAKPLQLRVLPRAEAVEFLQKRCGRDEPAVAVELCEALGDLPLALEHAGAYIEATGGSIAEYLDLYRSRPRELLTDAVAATWEISFERLQTEEPVALDLLYLVAFLAPDDIDPALVSPTFPDTLQFDRARGALRRYSLIDVSGVSIAVHRLVQAATRERLAREGQEQKWAESVLKLVNKAFPFKKDVVETWSPSTRLLPHAIATAAHSERLGVALEYTDRLLNEVGLCLDNRGQLGDAVQVLRRALAIAEKIYGPDHPEVAIDAGNLGQRLQRQGDLAGALQCAQRALAIDEKVYGPDHPKVAIDANNIGLILKDQGNLAGALQYAQRALSIDEKALGPDDPKVATIANNIGQILKDQGDLAVALRYTGRALAIAEKVYGPDHPTVAIDANNVGLILRDLGDMAGALHYTQRALAIAEKVYGPDHPSVAIDANNIGLILKDQGDLAGALPYHRRALRILQTTYGPDNPSTKRASENLALLEQALAKQADT